MPEVPPAGVPPRIPVPELNVTPVGKVPVSDRVGAGSPVAVTVKDPAAPTVNAVLFALATAAGWFTVKVKFCEASVPIPLCAVNAMGYVPDVPLAGVPLRIPVPGLNVTPEGNVPVSDRVGAGRPVAVTVNDPAEPTTNDELFALVIAAV